MVSSTFLPFDFFLVKPAIAFLGVYIAFLTGDPNLRGG